MPKSGQSWVNEDVWSPEIWCPGTFTFGSCSGFQDQPGLHTFQLRKGDSGAPKSLLFLISSSALHPPLSVFFPYPSSPLLPNSGQQVFPKDPLCAQLSPWGEEKTPDPRGSKGKFTNPKCPPSPRTPTSWPRWNQEASLGSPILAAHPTRSLSSLPAWILDRSSLEVGCA